MKHGISGKNIENWFFYENYISIDIMIEFGRSRTEFLQWTLVISNEICVREFYSYFFILYCYRCMIWKQIIAIDIYCRIDYLYLSSFLWKIRRRPNSIKYVVLATKNENRISRTSNVCDIAVILAENHLLAGAIFRRNANFFGFIIIITCCLLADEEKVKMRTKKSK